MSDSTRNNCWRLIVFEAASRYFFKKINFISYVFFRSRVESRSSRPSVCFQPSKTSLIGSPTHRNHLDNVAAASASAVADVPSIQRKISESVSGKKNLHNNNSLPQQSQPIAETQKDNNYYFLLLRGFVQFYFFLGSSWRDSRFVRWKKEKPFFRRLHHRRRKPREKEKSDKRASGAEKGQKRRFQMFLYLFAFFPWLVLVVYLLFMHFELWWLNVSKEPPIVLQFSQNLQTELQSIGCWIKNGKIARVTSRRYLKKTS